MAPQTRNSARRLAEHAQNSSPHSAAGQEQIKDGSVAKESGNSHSLDNEDERIGTDHPAPKPATPAKSISSRNKREVTSGDLRAVFGPKSKLDKIDFVKFLRDEKAWVSLTSEQQAILKAMCPKDSAWGKSELEQPSLDLLLHDAHWRSDVSTYKQDLANGYYDPAWIQEAEKATSRRNAGEFDDLKLEILQEYGGQKVDLNRKELGEKKQGPALSDLVAQELLQIGDEWSYSRSFGRGRKLVTVEHKFHMTSMDDYGKAQFRIRLPTNTTNLKCSSEDMEVEYEDGDKGIPDRINLGKQVKTITNEANQAEEQSSIVDVPLATSNTVQDDTAGVNPDSSMTETQSPKSVPSMAVFSIAVTEVEELEKLLLQHIGNDQNPGKTDPWKYFAVRREDQDVVSLQTLREEYWKKLLHHD